MHAPLFEALSGHSTRSEHFGTLGCDVKFEPLREGRRKVLCQAQLNCYKFQAPPARIGRKNLTANKARTACI
jgi:hypothetical protein